VRRSNIADRLRVLARQRVSPASPTVCPAPASQALPPLPSPKPPAQVPPRSWSLPLASGVFCPAQSPALRWSSPAATAVPCLGMSPGRYRGGVVLRPRRHAPDPASQASRLAQLQKAPPCFSCSRPLFDPRLRPATSPSRFH